MRPLILWRIGAVLILAVSFLIHLQLLPAFRDYCRNALPGSPLPNLTRWVIEFGGIVFVVLGILLALVFIMAEFAPAVRGLKMPMLTLWSLLLVLTVLGVMLVWNRAGGVVPWSPSSPPSQQTAPR